MPSNITHHPREQSSSFIMTSEGILLTHTQAFREFRLILAILTKMGNIFLTINPIRADVTLGSQIRWEV